MDEPGEYYTKGNKVVKERQIPYDFIHVESNEQTELTSKIETDPKIKIRLTAMDRER